MVYISFFSSIFVCFFFCFSVAALTEMALYVWLIARHWTIRWNTSCKRSPTANNKKDNLGKFRLDSFLIDHHRICIEQHVSVHNFRCGKQAQPKYSILYALCVKRNQCNCDEDDTRQSSTRARGYEMAAMHLNWNSKFHFSSHRRENFFLIKFNLNATEGYIKAVVTLMLMYSWRPRPRVSHSFERNAFGFVWTRFTSATPRRFDFMLLITFSFLFFFWFCWSTNQFFGSFRVYNPFYYNFNFFLLFIISLLRYAHLVCCENQLNVSRLFTRIDPIVLNSSRAESGCCCWPVDVLLSSREHCLLHSSHNSRVRRRKWARQMDYAMPQRRAHAWDVVIFLHQ